jgi:hypothetical protein
VTEQADNFKTTLAKALSDAKSHLADLTERCLETEDRANDVTAKLQARWQRRTELMRSRANTDGAHRSLGDGA